MALQRERATHAVWHTAAPAMSTSAVGARPIKAAPATNSASPTSSVRRRPRRSLSRPPPQEPSAAPATAVLTMTSWIQLSLQGHGRGPCQGQGQYRGSRPQLKPGFYRYSAVSQAYKSRDAARNVYLTPI